jgi:hypothetical protein
VQYDAASSGTAKDGIKYTFDDWGNVASYAEDRDSAVTGGGNQYTTSYTWVKATTGRNTLRKTDATIPGGRVLDYTYRTSGGLHDGDASRLTFVNDGATALARYWYNGVAQVVAQQYDQPDVMWNLYGSTGTYPDLDEFNRVVASRWTKDLATDKDFYSVALTYDRNSNITSADDSVHAGFDVLYTMDNTNRLTRAEEGTLGGGSISSRKRDEQWTLNHTGNWDRDKVDLNGDGDFVDAGELDDTRTHNVVNELTARDTDSNASNNYTLTYDGSGDMTDDGQSYKYEYDSFLRLRKVKNQSSALVAEYRYNGLGHRIAVHEDTDTDLDVDANDKWFYDAFDERWRHLARFRESDSSPKEDFVPAQAGLDGNGGSSYIDLVVCRNKDANTAWTSASDGNLEERIFHCQNWRADVSAIVTSSGTMKEWGKYSAYGIPFGLPGGDTESDGDCDSTDLTQVQTWINGSQYDLRGDIDLDADVDSNDKSTINGSFNGITLGRGNLSADGVASRRGLAGYQRELSASTMYCIRVRCFVSRLGRWIQRDPLPVVGIGSLVEYGSDSPLVHSDPSGAVTCQVAGHPRDGCKFPNDDVGVPITIQGFTARWRITGTFGDPNSSSCGAGGIVGPGDCQNSQCRYAVGFLLKIQYDEGFGWMSVTCCPNPPCPPNGPDLKNQAFWEFWHGTPTCGSGNGITPNWSGLNQGNHDGSSEVHQGHPGKLGTPGTCDLYTRLLPCGPTQAPQQALQTWRVTSAGPPQITLGLDGLYCVCGCGGAPAGIP